MKDARSSLLRFSSTASGPLAAGQYSRRTGNKRCAVHRGAVLRRRELLHQPGVQMFPNSGKKKTDTSARCRGVFFLRSSYMPVTARYALLIPPLSLQTASFTMESGTVRIRPFPGLQKTLLRHSPAASFFPHAPFTLPRRTARPQVHRLLHAPFIPRGRAKEMSCTHRTALARFQKHP